MLALFETLSYKGWNVIRDILWVRQGPVRLFLAFLCLFNFKNFGIFGETKILTY